MVDDLGSRAFIRSEHCTAMERAGVRLARAQPIRKALRHLLRGLLEVRNHRKIVVIDDGITLCGSQNCADPEFAVKPKYAPWVDAVVRFEGPVARQNQRLLGNHHDDISRDESLVLGRQVRYHRAMGESLRMAHVSIDDYLAGERTAEQRHEYVDGELFAMGGASRAHNSLAANLLIRLGAHIEGGPCRIASSDMKVRPAIATRFYYPDLVVSCNDPAEEEDVYVETHPTIVVEILSASTEQTDRREKRVAYQGIATLREYVLVAQDARRVQVYRRDGADWLVDVFGPAERTALKSVGFVLDVDDLYRNVDIGAS